MLFSIGKAMREADSAVRDTTVRHQEALEAYTKEELYAQELADNPPDGGIE